MGHEFLKVIILITSIPAILLFIIWGLYLFKKQKKLSKSIFGSIKSKKLNFIGLIIFFGATMSIVSGSMMANVQTIRAVNEIIVDGNLPSAAGNHAAQQINVARMKLIHKSHKPGAESDGSKCLLETECDFNDMYNDDKYSHWNISGKEFTSFEDWVDNFSPAAQVEKFIFNSIDYYSGDNRIAMAIYIYETILKEGYIWSNETNNPGNINSQDFSWKIQMYKEFEIFRIDTKAKIMMIPSKNNPNMGIGTNSENINKLLMKKNTSSITVDNQGFVSIPDGEGVILDNYLDLSNNIKLGDDITFTKTLKKLKVTGSGFMPYEMNRGTIWDAKKDYSKETTIFVNEKTFFDLVFNNSLPSTFEELGEAVSKGLGIESFFSTKEAIQTMKSYDNTIDAYATISSENNYINHNMTIQFKNLAQFHFGFLPRYIRTTDFGGVIPPSYDAAINNLIIDPSGTHLSIDPAVIGPAPMWASGLANLFNQIKLQTIFNGELLILLVIINIIIIFIFIKKRLDDNKKQLATLKSLGYKSSIITLSYLIIPISLSLIGGSLGLLFGLGVQKYWLMFSGGSFSVPYGTIEASYFVFSSTLLAPTIVISCVSFFFTYYNLKKPIIDALSGATNYKPNVLVKSWGKVSKNRNSFMINYKFKNIFRQIGKSSFIFVSIISSTLIFAMGASFSRWGASAAHITQSPYGDVTMGRWYFDNSSLGNTPQEFKTYEEIDQEIELGITTPYTFGNKDESLINFLGLLKTPLSDTFEADKAKNKWANNIVEYMLLNTITDKYMNIGLAGDVSAGMPDIWIGIKKIVNNPSALIKVTLLFEKWISNNDYFKIITNLVGWANGGKDNLGGLCGSKCKKDIQEGSHSMFIGFSKIVFQEGSVMPPFFETLFLSSQLKTINESTIINHLSSNGLNYEVDITEVSAAMSEIIITGLLGSIHDDTINGLLSYIIGNTNKLPLLRFKESYITPGVAGYDSNNSYPFSAGIEGLNGFNSNSNLNINFTEDAREFSEMKLTGGGNPFDKAIEYSNINNSGRKNLNEIALLPSYIDAAKISNGLFPIDNMLPNDFKLTTAYPASLMEWESELHTNVNSEGILEHDPNGPINPKAKWTLTTDTSVKIEDYSFMFNEFKRIEHPSNPSQVIWKVPILFQDQLNPSINTAKKAGVNIHFIDTYKTFVPTGPINYIGDNGALDFMKDHPYNALAKVKNRSNPVEIYEKYQSLWSPQLSIQDPSNRFLIYDDTSGFDNPIDSFGAPLPIPFPLTLLGDMVSVRYRPFTLISQFFAASSIIITSMVMILLTKEVIDSTKKEASILKSMGYKNTTITSLTVDGQGIIMIVSFLSSIPISILVLSMISEVLTSLTGMEFYLSTQINVFFIIFGILLLLFILIYLLALFMNKIISPLYSLSEK